MKTRSLLIALLSFFSFSATAQLELGGGLAFGTEISNIGLQARGLYGINDQFDGVFNMTYFLPDKEKAGSFESKATLFTLNFDGHYAAYSNDNIEVYPLLGLNITIVTVKVEGDFFGTKIDEKDSQTEIGLNIGGGAAFGVSDGLDLFGEVKYVASDFDQAVFTFGVLKAL